MKLSSLQKDTIIVVLIQMILFAILGAIMFMAFPNGLGHLVPSYLFHHLKAYGMYEIIFYTIYYSFTWFYWHWLNHFMDID